MHVLALAAALCNAHPVYGLKPHASPAIVGREGTGYYRAQERLWFTVVERTRAHVPARDLALVRHAAGHRVLATRYARETAGTISGMGASPTLARRALARAAARFIAESKRELDREERSYERVTDDGLAQQRGAAFGYPGGPDATTICGD